ncbi:MAG TPA: branched-chain amino acid ABC transporter substrate-binding protein [Candidatus Baltobacteraceae bacterium]|nr:branched-chain amino acid ABC transporter substrate-binding protein [Candidatus Baltobacteraceae bacterium]
MNRLDFLGGVGATTAAVATPVPIAPYTPTLRVAVICPQSGDDRALGMQLVNGVRSACDYLNNERSTFNRALLYTAFDDHNTAADAIVQAGFATGNPDVLAVIGHMSAGATLAALQTYATAQIALVVPTVTDDEVTAKGYRNVFRLPTRDGDEGALLAAYALTAGSKTPLVVTQDSDYGPGVARGFLSRAAAQHVNGLLTSFGLDKPNFAKVAADIVAHAPDSVTLAGTAGDMGPLLPALRAHGYAGKLYASQGFFDEATLKQYGSDAEGLIVSTDVPYYPLAPTAVPIVREFEQRYGRLTPVTAFGFAAVQLIYAAQTRTQAANRLTLLRAIAFGGTMDTITGSYTFSATGDPVQPNVYFYTVKGGKFVYDRQAHSSGFMLK